MTDTTTATQHTPGPWEADHDGYVFAGIAAVGRAFPQGFGLSHDEATQRDANARLIGAAPALLDAAAATYAEERSEHGGCDIDGGLCRVYGFDSDTDADYDPHATVRGLRDALSAATGRSY